MGRVMITLGVVELFRHPLGHLLAQELHQSLPLAAGPLSLHQDGGPLHCPKDGEGTVQQLVGHHWAQVLHLMG